MSSPLGVASMPMYDLPEVRKALDTLWQGLARHLHRQGVPDAPNTLSHERPVSDLWNDPDLFLSQCCGYDIVNRYAGQLLPIATPHYGAPECMGCDYASVVVVAEQNAATDVLEMRGAVCVINGPESHSGMNALRGLVAPVSRDGRFFTEVKVSGSHEASLAMIRRGEAEVGAIDCVTFALLERNRPEALAGLRKLGRTYRAPGLPYVTGPAIDDDRVARMRMALFSAFADPDLVAARQALLLDDIEILPEDAYARMREVEDLAARYGFSLIH